MTRPAPVLVNAENRAKEFKHFHIPTRRRRESVRADDLAEVVFDGEGKEEERAWLKVVKVHKDSEGVVYLGVATKDSKFTDDCEKGMSVEFGPEHILAIMLR